MGRCSHIPQVSNKVFLVSGPSPFGPRPPEPSALLFSKRAVHPWPTPRPLRPPRPRRRCAAATRRLRRHALELLVRQAPRWHRAPAVMCQVHMTAAARDAHPWTCSQASHARQQAGAARAPLHRLLLQPQVLRFVLLGTGTFVGTRILFGPRASGPQTSFRMAPPRERGAGDASSEHC